MRIARDRLLRMPAAEIGELLRETLPTLGADQWQATIDAVLGEVQRRKVPVPTP